MIQKMNTEGQCHGQDGVDEDKVADEQAEFHLNIWLRVTQVDPPQL